LYNKIIIAGIIGLLILSGLPGIIAVETEITNKNIRNTQESSTKIEDDVYYDVDVLIFGRCRTLGVGYEDPDGPNWTGYFFIGDLVGFFVDTCGYYDEWMLIIIRNEIITERFFEIRGDLGISCINASGIFYWGAKLGCGFRLIAPRIFVKCHAEIVFV
jgi:hypothetical protein